MGIDGWIGLIVLALPVMIGTWRYHKVSQPLLSPDECKTAAALVVDRIFEVSGDAKDPVGVLHSPFWRDDLGLTTDQWIYLCWWMRAQGLVELPKDFGWRQRIGMNPPETMALTRRSWEDQMDARRQPAISIGNNTGNINFGGVQMVFEGQRLSGEELITIATALRQDAKTLPELQACHVEAAAGCFEKAASGAIDPQSPEVTGTLDWVRQRAGEAVGNAAGSALYAATLAALRAAGII